jgi:hypothetical protein
MNAGENVPTPSTAPVVPDPAAPAATTPAEKKHWWDKILTITPIILTVLATFLAGKSSGEMTKAMYYRSMAAQEESKGANQWNYFQAKRIRGQGLDVARSDLLLQCGGKAANDKSMAARSKQFNDDLKEAQGEADKLIDLLQDQQRLTMSPIRPDESPPKPSVAWTRPMARCGALQKIVQKLQAKALEPTTTPENQLASVEGAADYFGTRNLPRVPDEGDEPSVEISLKPALDSINKALWESIEAIRARKPETEINVVLIRLRPGDVQKAVDLAEDRAARFDVATRPFPEAYRKAVAAAAARERLALDLENEVADTRVALLLLPTPLTPEASHVAASLGRRAERLHRTAQEELRAAEASRLDFDFRRYRREGDYNQFLGYLREMQARRSALESDRHHYKSEMYFYAMLAAQVGVTISTFALAVRLRSTLWGVASLAGVAAIGVAGYVGYTHGF